jgi:glycine amidinotransferase/scyllo-inosamine-4-phosphate amidinotransferase 1
MFLGVEEQGKAKPVKLNSCNEWDPLKVVVVGSVEGFSPGLEFGDRRPEMLDTALGLVRKAYPQWYLDEVAEDLEALCAIFRQAGVLVVRPRWSERSWHFATPNWMAGGFDIYNIRDLHIVVGDTLVVSAPSSRFRLFETYALQDIFYRHFFDDGFRWVSAPVPRQRGEYRHEIRRTRSELEAAEDKLHQQLSRGLDERFHYLDEDEIIFDAANIIRVDRDILFLVSSTGNRKAAAWLASVLGPEYYVHVTHAYRSSHLDSTILPLRRGGVLLNGARVNDETCPKIFDGWDKLFFTDVASLPESEVRFHQSIRVPVHQELLELGVTSQLNHISSPWAGLNVMSIDPRTVLVHDRQTKMIRMLEASGYTVVPVRMRHCYTMLGGLHCTTLDVVREPAA